MTDTPQIIDTNSDFFIIYKPEGFIIYRQSGGPKDGKYLSDYYSNEFLGEKWEDTERLGFAHRIDMDTSGLVLACRNQLTLRQFQSMFKDRQIQKWYLAIVHGQLPSKGVINAPIQRNSGVTRKVGSGIHAKSATSIFYNMGYSKDTDTSLLLIYLHTGRTHQIRVHLQSIKHPIVGDRQYGRGPGGEHLALLSFFIAFEHDGRLFEFVSPIPDFFLDKLKPIIDLSELMAGLNQSRKSLSDDWSKIFSLNRDHLIKGIDVRPNNFGLTSIK